MKTSRKLLGTAAAVLCLVSLVVLSTAIGVGQKTYRVEPEITLPEYRTDAARAIDAYERLMERYMDLTEKGMLGAGADVQGIVAKLDSIEGKLTELSVRVARIEKALGIEPPPTVAEKEPQPEVCGAEGAAKPPIAGTQRGSITPPTRKSIPVEGERSARR